MKMYRNSLNKYDDSKTVWLNGYLNDNGDYTATGSSHYTTNFTEVQSETTYYLGGNIGQSGNSHRIYYYDDNYGWIGRSASLSSATYVFTTPANCKYIQIQVVQSVTTAEDWMLTEGDTAQAFEPYNVVDWYGYTYQLRASGAWTDGTEKKRSGGAWT